MPELDGLDASRRICERWPDTRPRIIAMTANALPEDREACFAAGMDDYVAKPIRPDELAEALKRVRAGSPGRRAARHENAGGLLDGAALESLRELGGDDFLAEVIDTFLADAPALAGNASPRPRGGRHRRASAGGAYPEVERRHPRGRRSSPSAAARSSSRRRKAVWTEASEPRRADRARSTARSSGRSRSCAGGGDVSASASRPASILVADDNRMNRLLLGRSLEQQGHTVVFAENGREALELLRQQRFDVLLLDVLMPELDGYRVLAGAEGRHSPSRHPGRHDVRARRARQRREVHRDGR